MGQFREENRSIRFGQVRHDRFALADGAVSRPGVFFPYSEVRATLQKVRGFYSGCWAELQLPFRAEGFRMIAVSDTWYPNLLDFSRQMHGPTSPTGPYKTATTPKYHQNSNSFRNPFFENSIPKGSNHKPQSHKTSRSQKAQRPTHGNRRSRCTMRLAWM